MLKLMLKKILKNEKGFSLLELIIVVSIMGILASQVMPVINSSDSARVVAHKTNITYLRSAISRFEAEKISINAFTAGDENGDSTTDLKYGDLNDNHILVTHDFLQIDQFENPWKGTGSAYQNYEYQIYNDGNNKAKVTLAAPGVVDDSNGQTTASGAFVYYDKTETEITDSMKTNTFDDTAGNFTP